MMGQNNNITGIVMNDRGKPMTDLNIFLTPINDETNVLAYSLTDKHGHFSISITNNSDSLSLRVTGINIKPYNKSIRNNSEFHKITVVEESQLLKEVKVTASKLYANKDTLNYNVQSFLRPEDFALADVLKRMPGVTVNDAGVISYMGKDISKLKIEGIDLMKDHYGLASNNLDPKNIATVQIIPNDQDVKALKGLQPEDRASINIKLKKGAMGVFNIISTIGGGHESRTSNQGRRFLFDEQLLAMYFSRTMQLFTNYEGNNDGHDISQELHTKSIGNQTYTPQITGIYPVQTNSLKKKNYYFNNSHTITYNQILRTASNSEIGLNAAYWTDRNNISSQQHTMHLLPDNGENSFQEYQYFKGHQSMLYGDLSYISNKDLNYNKELLSFNYNRNKTFGTTVNNKEIGQKATYENYRLSNDFQWVKRNSKYQGVQLHSKINLERSPQNLFADTNLFPEDIQATNIFQTVRRTNITFNNDMQWLSAFTIKGVRLHPEIMANYQEDGIRSDLTAFVNNLSMKQYVFGGGLNGSYILPKIKVYFYLPIEYHNSKLTERRYKDDMHYANTIFDPNAEVIYNPNTSNQFRLKWSKEHSSPQIDQLYTNPILLSYRELTAYDGSRLYEGYSRNLLMEWNYRDILGMRFIGIPANIGNEKPHVLYGSYFQDNTERIMSVQSNEKGHNASVTGRFSKGFALWNMKLECNGAYYYKDYPLLLQKEVERDITNTMFWGMNLYATPCAHFTLEWQGQWRQYWSKMSEGPKLPMVRQISNDISIKCSLPYKILLNPTFHHYYNSSNYGDRTFWLSDLNMSMTVGHVLLLLVCENLFNERQYINTTNGNLTREQTSFPLRGRSVLLKARIKIL